VSDTQPVLSKKENMREALKTRAKRTIPSVVASSIESDDKSIAEAKALSTGDLEKKASQNEHSRTERFRDHVARAIICLFWVVFAGVILAGSIWFFHLITPDKWHFLTPVQTDKIGNQLFGGIVSAFISGYAKKRLN
jgi:hypothetical protein